MKDIMVFLIGTILGLMIIAAGLFVSPMTEPDNQNNFTEDSFPTIVDRKTNMTPIYNVNSSEPFGREIFVPTGKNYTVICNGTYETINETTIRCR